VSLELFRTTNIDWLGKKWYFLGFSLIFSVLGVLSMLFWHHIPLGVDFKGGTQIRVAFDQTPNEDHLRQAMDKAGVRDFTIQRVSDPSGHAANKVIIALPEAGDGQVGSAPARAPQWPMPAPCAAEGKLAPPKPCEPPPPKLAEAPAGAAKLWAAGPPPKLGTTALGPPCKVGPAPP